MKSQLVAVALTTAISTGVFAQTKLETDTEKLSYALGMLVGERVLKNYGELDYDILLESMKAQKDGTETLLSIEEVQNILRDEQMKEAELRLTKAKEAGAEFMAENAKKDGVMVTESGLQYEVLSEGEGEKPSLVDTVSVYYKGTLIDGTEFDSSAAPNPPTDFEVGKVIPGWTEGVQLMNVGSKYRFVIPSDLGYGDRGIGQDIMPGDTLVFEVELVAIKAK